MPTLFIHPLALSLCLLHIACAAKPASTSKRSAKDAPTSPWTCPDSLRYIISEVAPPTPGQPWRAPAEWGRDTATRPRIHPGLYLTIIRSQDGKADTGEKEFVEPNFPWVGDLNGDGRTDFILRDGVGLSKETAVLVECGQGGYFPVFHAMADEILVEDDPDPKRKWKRLLLRYWPIGSRESRNSLMRWDGKAYRTTCEFKVPEDSPPAPTSTYCP